MMTCLTNIVGITQSACECIVQGLTTDQRAALALSTSGLYLDDLEGGVHLKALKSIDACKGLSVMATEARNNAITRLEKDLIVAINTKYKKDRANYQGQIGRMSFAQSMAVTRNLQGIRITPNDQNDGVITLNKLYIILNQAVTVNVKVYRVFLDSVMGEELFSWPVTTQANAYVQVPIGANPVALPLVYNGEIVEYYFLYDITEPGVPVQPKDNTLVCSTCDKGRVPYTDFIKAEGVQVNSASQLNDKTTDTYSHGLILEAEIKCDNETLFCREYKADDAVAVTMSYAVLYKAGELLIEEVLKSPDVNRYTTMAREYLWGKRNHFRAEYDARITYLTFVIDVSASNCYVCREANNQPFWAGIVS